MMKNRKIMSVALIGLMLMSNTTIPVNAEQEKDIVIQEYQDFDEQINSTNCSSDDIMLNYRDDVEIYADSVHANEEIARDYADVLPSSYKTEGLPSIRNQNPYGTCWAFSSTALAEISIIKQENKEMDLSESHLAYFTYQGVKDPLGGIEGDINGLNTGDFRTTGGSLSLAVHAYSAWKGAALESDYMYSNIASLNSENMKDEDAFNDAAHLRNAYFINMDSDVDEVKKMIMKYGAVGISYYEDFNSYDSVFNSYYQTTHTDTNHAVSVVGWNDDFPASDFVNSAPGNGAWLVRNSWGDGSESHNGYFWISYYDTSIFDTAYVFDFVSDENEEFYDNNYQYDGGICSTYTSTSQYKMSYANIFQTQHDTEELKAVGIGAAKPNMKYHIKIYKNLTDLKNPESGDLVETVSGTTTFMGLYTIKLTNPVYLSKDTVYSVVVVLEQNSTGVGLYAETTIDNWVTSTTHINEGESFFKVGELTWEDYADYYDGNIRIKAFTNDVEKNCEYFGHSIDTYGVCLVCGSVDIGINTSINIVSNDVTYNGKQQSASVTVKFNDKILEKNVDYTISDISGTNAGKYEVTITGIGKYTSSKKITWEIKKANPTYNIPVGITADCGEMLYNVSLGDTGFTWSDANEKLEAGLSEDGITITKKAKYTPNDSENYNVIDNIEISIKVSHRKRDVRENIISATCKDSGTYDDVTYCDICKRELNRVKKVEPKTENHDYTNKIWNMETHKLKCTVCGVDGDIQDISVPIITDLSGYGSECTEQTTILIRVQDMDSGIYKVVYTIDGNDTKYVLFDSNNTVFLKEMTINLLDGTHTYKIVAMDNAGNQSDTKEITVNRFARVMPKWVYDGYGYWYDNGDGTYPYNSWKFIDEKWYYFDASGYMVTGWLQDGVNWYYLESSGEMATSKWVDGNYYIKSNGIMATNEWVDGGRYYVDMNGKWVPNKAKSEWKNDGYGYWYDNGDGTYPYNTWKLIGGKWYYFNASGYMVTGWLKDGGNWYYLESSGEMATSKWVDGNYYIKSNGIMATNEWVDGGMYYVDENGKWVPGKTKQIA